MNIEKRTEVIKKASNEIKNRAEAALYDVYMKGYNEGRHDYRNKIKNCLIVDPNSLGVLKKNAEDPCKTCPNNRSDYKIGCMCDPSNCIAKQNQFIALDILENFKQYESICRNN